MVSALLLCAAWAAHAQDSATTNSSAGNNSATSSGPVLGPPALKDFQLEPRERLVTQPAPSPQRPAVTTPAQPSPSVRRPVTADRPAVRPTEPRAPRTDPSPEARSTVTPPSVSPLPPARNQPQSETLPSPLPDSATTPPTTADLNPPRPPSEAAGGSAWLYAVPFFALLVVGLAFLRRRRRQERPAEPHVALPANPPTIAAEPRTGAAQRPWLELDLKAQRASYTDTEWVVQFELSVSNTGPIPARDLRIDVMLFNAGKEQDKEISAFFRTAGREATKLNLPGLKAGETGIIDGEVAMALA
ncbi:MAG: hypothetical protein ACXW2T_04080, partial [Allosphingosinicella sp.]